MISVSEIAERLNREQADALARELLPNGHYGAGRNQWCASGIADTGRSASLVVDLAGDRRGHWRDYGNAGPGEERGDMIDLLRLRMGLATAADAVAEAKRRLSIHDDFRLGAPQTIDPAERARRADAARERAEARDREVAAEREVKAKRAKALFLGGKPIAGTPAEAYLRGRMLDPGPSDQWPGSLRFHGDVWNREERAKIPAMVSAIYDAAGAQIGTHRTYLQACARRGWVKIDSPNAKMVLGCMWGGFVPIAKGASGKPMAKMPAGEPVYVTEGIEDAVCVRMMKPDARIVAAISLPNIGGIVLPPAARRLVIVADRDVSPKAQDQLERAIAVQQARGLEVKLVMPPVGVKDINDWWQLLAAERQRGAA